MARLPIPECDCFVSTLPPPEVLAPGLGLSVVYTKPLCLGTDHVTIPGCSGPQPGSPSVKARHLLSPPYFLVWPRKSQSGSHLLPGPWLPFLSLHAWICAAWGRQRVIIKIVINYILLVPSHQYLNNPVLETYKMFLFYFYLFKEPSCLS